LHNVDFRPSLPAKNGPASVLTQDACLSVDKDLLHECNRV
jgi:hypothetical protein